NDKGALGLPDDPNIPCNSTTGFTTNQWTRYPHIKWLDERDRYHFYDPFNPYVGYMDNENSNLRRYFPFLINTPLQDIPFTHSFLESPRINTGTAGSISIDTTNCPYPAMPAGDIYEIKTLLHYPFTSTNNVESAGFCNFDIKIVSGSGSESDEAYCNPSKA